MFVTSTFRSYLDNQIIKKIYVQMRRPDQELLLNGLVEIMEHIADVMFLRSEQQYKQNKNRDIRAILNMLLPYVINDSLDEKKGQLKSIADIYMVRRNDQFVFSNVQYNMCDKTTGELLSWNVKLFQDNLALLKETISLVGHKLYVNWINVRPITMDQYKGSRLYERDLPRDDYYECVVHEWFEKIKNIKWTIYDYVIDGKPVPLMKIARKLGRYGKSWGELEDFEQARFRNKWNGILNSGEQVDQYLVVVLAFFYQKYQEDLGIDELKVERDEEQEDRFVSINLRDAGGSLLQTVIRAWKTVDAGQVYGYLHQVHRKFEKTWFSLNLDQMPKVIDGKFLTLKNHYNFAKSLCHYNKGGKYVQYPKFWRSLNSSEKKEVGRRFRGSAHFNINQIIRRTYGGGSNITSDWIYQQITNKLKDNVFEMLIQRGVLSELVPDPELTDFNTYPDDYVQKIVAFNQRMGKLIGREGQRYMNHACYYLTQDLYGRLRSGFIMGLAKQTRWPWMTTYAMDWVSQINFFHRYLNNRMIMVTGATGAGKSTQVPKLLMYGLTCLDYMDRGQIICTQPRRSPAEDVPTGVADELGVPLDQDYYYMQWQHSKDKHTSPLAKEHLSIKMVTDGILWNQVANDPLKLKYNIVIVDESHEHNANMDMILTQMRYAAYHMPKIKLAIISATIDDDEPIYRRYYRDISDEFLEPINQSAKLYDRIAVDRRFDMSPPGETTRFKITDIYLSEGEARRLIKGDIKDTIEATIDRAIVTTQEILRSSSNGHILFFVTGKRQIERVVKTLNQNTPANVIALPFMGTLVPAERELVAKAGKMLKTLTVPKSIVDTEIHLEAGSGQVPPGTYKRCVIVATNAAEASITISNLKYVIDIGYANVSEFDPRTRQEQLPPKEISESSRMQRRGRVGRVADGTVYYMYEFGARADNRTEYNICNQSVDGIIYELLQDKPGEEPIKDVVEGIPTMFKTGYEKETVVDANGEFYLIHPEEKNLERDILGRPLPKPIVSPNVDVAFEMLAEKLFYVGLEKTEYGKKVMALASAVGITSHGLSAVLAWSYGYGVEKEMLHMIAMRSEEAANLDVWVNETMVRGKPRKDYDLFNRLYHNTFGDLMSFYLIYQNISQAFGKLKIFKTDWNLRSHFGHQKEMFFRGETLDPDVKEILQAMNQDGNLLRGGVTEEELEEYQRKSPVVKKKLMAEIGKAESWIERWAPTQGLKVETVIEYLKRYVEMAQVYYQPPEGFDLVELWLRENLRPKSGVKNKILMPYIHAFHDQVVMRKGENKYQMKIADQIVHYVNPNRRADIQVHVASPAEKILYISTDRNTGQLVGFCNISPLIHKKNLHPI